MLDDFTSDEEIGTKENNKYVSKKFSHLMGKNKPKKVNEEKGELRKVGLD